MSALAEAEKRIRELLDRHGGLPSEVREHVCSYLDAGENEVALDMLGDYIVEHELPVSHDLVDDMAKAYGFMSVKKPRNIAFLKERARASNA